MAAARRAWDWLDQRGLQPLLVATAAALTATLLVALAHIVSQGCSAQCPAYTAVPAALLMTIGIITLLAGLAVAGHWVAAIMHRTWLDHAALELEAMGLEAHADADRQRRLATVSDPTSVVAQIHAHGRQHLWTGGPVAIFSLLGIPAASSSFGQAGPTSFLLPVLALAVMAGTAASARGIILLRAAKRIVAPKEARAADA